MPNHVTSVVAVTGPESEVATFVAAHFKDVGEAFPHFDFETIVARPDSVAKTVSRNILTPQQQADQDAAFAETGFRDWYSWARHNWGTQWGAYQLEIQERSDGRVKFRVQTAWSVPRPIFDALLLRYPALQFDCACFEECDFFAGKGRYGVDFECCIELVSDALYEEVYGRAREYYEDE